MKTYYLEKAIKITGSQADLARALRVSPAYVWKMLNSGHIPLSQCLPIERATAGKVTRQQLRPDVFS